MLGNIHGIINSSGSYVVKYSYNAFGVPNISIESGYQNNIVANNNPFMFKGYYYDDETGLYYCNYRYYYPLIARWISPDSFTYLNPQSLISINLYSYCENNPIMYVDENGNFFFLTFLITLALPIATTIGANIVASQVIEGAIDYAVWEHAGMIFSDNQSIIIENSWCIKGGLSRATFLTLMYANPKYQSDLNNGERNFFNYLMEWDLHNFAANLLFSAGAVLYLPSLISSNTTIASWILKKFNQARSVDMEASKDWFSNMWESLFI